MPTAFTTEGVAGFLETPGVLGPGPVRRIDTHAASIFLAGDRAWKLKRPVRLGYLDFSTVERRKAVLEAELALNRRTAPDLYLALHPITRTRDGTIALDGPGQPIEWLLEMRRFPDDALLDEHARRGALGERVAIRLAETIHDFHSNAAPETGAAGSAKLLEVVEGNAASFAACKGVFDDGAVDALLKRQREALMRHADLLDARARAGRVRHCHGDLHLANIALIDDVPVPFDCLEFDAQLATTDVLYDLAFLLMDLWHRDLRDDASLVFNRYFDLSGVDEAGVQLMPLLLSIRAAIRAHVAATQAMHGNDAGAIARAHSYLGLAASLLDPVPPILLAIGGRSGTGKSTLARALAASIGAAPGARILRSDVLRKRLAGLAPEDRLPTTDYTVAASALVYSALHEACRTALSSGSSVIADAAFLERSERDGIAEVARQSGARLVALWLVAGLKARIDRVSARRGDASDADAHVVRRQAKKAVGVLGDWHRLTTGRTPIQMVRAAQRVLTRERPSR